MTYSDYSRHTRPWNFESFVDAVAYKTYFFPLEKLENMHSSFEKMALKGTSSGVVWTWTRRRCDFNGTWSPLQDNLVQIFIHQAYNKSQHRSYLTQAVETCYQRYHKSYSTWFSTFSTMHSATLALFANLGFPLLVLRHPARSRSWIRGDMCRVFYLLSLLISGIWA